MDLGPTPRTENAALLKYHKQNHFWGYSVPMEYCWYCQRNSAVCRSKKRWTDARTAHEVSVQINREEGWEKPVSPYYCRVCLGIHLTSKPTKRRNSRWKKQQRKAMMASDGVVA